MDKNKELIQAINDNNSLIFKVAAMYTNNREDRNDLSQEITYQLWRSFDRFNNKSGITTWMYKVAMNTAIYFLKKEKRRIPTVALNADANEFTEEALYDEEKWKTLKLHVDKLNLLDKGIVLLYLENKNYDEIAQIIGISPSNVGTKLTRIKEKLRNQILK